jgi:predicted TIM-barrel fold metal-dependent hydrolase
MRQRAISGDSHIDLSWMPPQLFVDEATPALKSRMPFVVDSPEGPRWTTNANVPLGFACQVGATGRKYVPGMSARTDKMAAEGLFDDGANGIRRVSEPKLRIEAQDRDQIDGELIYGILGMSDRLKDPVASVEMLRIYNDWLVDFCQFAPQRLLGLAQIPCHDVNLAVAEASRIATTGGLRGFDMAAAGKQKPYFHPDWTPFWELANETRIPVHFHTFGPEMPDMTGWDAPTKEKARGAAFARGQFLRASDILSGLIMGGVLDRHSSVRIVFAESGIGWIPYLLDRLNWCWEEEFKNSLALSLRPSEYWHRQCYASFQAEESALPVLQTVGYDNVLWASDFPHPDGLWPDSQQFIAAMFGDMDPLIRDKIVYGNAAKLYGLE